VTVPLEPGGPALPISTFAHELRQPLRAIITQCQLLLRRDPAQVDANAESLHAIVAAGKLQDALIASIVEFCDIDFAAAAEVQPLQLCAQGACLQVEKQRVSQQGTIYVGELPAVDAPWGVSKVMEKVLDNALKFCEPGHPPVVTLTAKMDGNWLTIAIDDEGLGVASAYRESIFRPFVRLHPASRFPGHGMGLAFCSKMIIGLGGQIMFLEPPDGRRTRVAIRLPAEQAVA